VRVEGHARPGRIEKADHLEHLFRTGDRLTSLESVQARKEQQVLEPGDPEVERPVTRRNEPDDLTELPRGLSRVHAQHAHVPAARLEQAAEDAQQGCLAGTVGADDRVDLALVGGERDAVERDRGPEVPGQVTNFDYLSRAVRLEPAQ
jgi:hypothetical protein